MRAVLIDPFLQSVEEVDLPEGSDPDAIKAYIKAPWFDSTGLGSGVVAFVDDEGLLRKGQRFWHFATSGVPMAGRALLVSIDDQGETVALDPRVRLDVLRTIVMWLGDAPAMELMIQLGVLDRPTTKVNDAVIWEWTPQACTEELPS